MKFDKDDINITVWNYLFLFTFLFWWLSGIVLAKGFWSTLSTIIFPPYGLYLVVERLLHMWGMT